MFRRESQARAWLCLGRFVRAANSANGRVVSRQRLAEFHRQPMAGVGTVKFVDWPQAPCFATATLHWHDPDQRFAAVIHAQFRSKSDLVQYPLEDAAVICFSRRHL